MANLKDERIVDLSDVIAQVAPLQARGAGSFPLRP
jgi:hypothetical protein